MLGLYKGKPKVSYMKIPTIGGVGGSTQNLSFI